MTAPLIVAEMSANHLGSIERALSIIDAAAKIGADAVKLQTWSEMLPPGMDAILATGPWADRNLRDLYDRAKTPWEWHESLFAFAKGRGIEIFSSVFDLESLDFLESLGCPRYKISSFELTDLRLIDAVASTKKPLIISTGMATLEEVGNAIDSLRSDVHVTLLKCSSAYPAPVDELNLEAIRTLADEFCLDVGFSDHTMGYAAAVAATALGATMIEKHLTIRRSDGGPDAGFSAEPEELWTMIQMCQQTAAMVGTGDITGPTRSEMPQLDLRRSLYYRRDSSAGEVLSSDDILSARPALGMFQADYMNVMDKPLTRDVKAGDPVRRDDYA